MVEVMMASIAPLMQVQHHGLESSAAVYAGDDATMTFGAHTCSPASRPDGQNDPSKCIMWCAIGLGALVQGAPVEKVSTHYAGAELRTRTEAGNFAVQDKISTGVFHECIGACEVDDVCR